MSPEISVIIPVYNRTELLTYVVNSALGQTVRVREVILIDDGSGPHVQEAIQRKIASDTDWSDRVRYIRQENQGQAVALMNGIAHAKGEWIVFGADDDFFLPNKLEWQFRALEEFKGKCELCFSDAWFMNNPAVKTTVFQLAAVSYKDPMGKIEDLHTFVKHQYQAWVQTVIARKDAILRAGGFDSTLRYSEDLDFMFRMSLTTGLCYVNMPLVVIDRRPPEKRHVGHAANWNKEEFRLRMDQYRYEKALKLVQGLEEPIQKEIRTNLRKIHSNWSNLHISLGHDESALESVSKAAQYGMTPNLALKWFLVRFAPKLTRKAMSARERLTPGLSFR